MSSTRRWGLPLIAAASTLLCGYTYVNNTIDWQYFGTPTSADGLTYTTSNGSPTFKEFARTLPANLPALPADLVSKVKFMLPEGKDIRQNSQGLLPDSDDKTNVRFKEDADVWVTFISEGAGYLNSVGFFAYDQASPPQFPKDVAEKIIFTNASMNSPLEEASSSKQNTVYLGEFKAGQALGFMIAANAFSGSGRLYNGKRIAGVKDNMDPKWIFYTLRGLNPEKPSAQNLNVHTVMLKDASDASDGYQRMVIGFEDINRESGGDHDFNDVVLAVHITPRRAIANIDTVQPLAAPTDADTDKDGVKDALDEFPNDATKAFSRYYPTSDGWGTLAYEDLWPKRGDYDMNDMVIRYRTREVMNAARQVTAIEADYRLDARGADIESGFAVQLPGIAASTIQSASVQIGSAAATPLTSEAGQSLATFVLFNSAAKELPGASAACPFANTQAECASVPVKSMHLSISFKTPQASTNFSSPYNPFIFRTAKRGHEVHLPGKAPTALADSTIFGTQDDRTSGSKTYVDKNGRPWALDIPVLWRYPNETIDLTVPYPNMATWAASGGTQQINWYVQATVPKWLYVTK